MCAKTHKNISSCDFELSMFCKKHTTQQEEIVVTQGIAQPVSNLNKEIRVYWTHAEANLSFTKKL